jgi:hypothetical protein
MLTLFAAATGLLSAPEMLPGEIQYPSMAIRRNQSAAALMDVVIDPQGVPVGCQTLETFGDEKLADEICDMQGALRYKPATNDAGEPSYGIARLLIKLSIVGTKQGDWVNELYSPGNTLDVYGAKVLASSNPRAPKFETEPALRRLISHSDVTFEVRALPGTDGDSLVEQVIVAVDPAGKITDCLAAADQVGDDDHPAYEDAACQQLQDVKLGDPVVIDDAPVSYVRPLEVQFLQASSD